MKTYICIPTYNAGNSAKVLVESMAIQSFKPAGVVIVDSGSTDDTVETFTTFGSKVVIIDNSQFDHGRTRQMFVDMLPDADFLLFMTQDVVIATPNSLELLLQVFTDEKITAVYGRQLPRMDANAIEAHGRFFNYPDSSRVKSFADAGAMGIKAAFFSNAFSAYRRDALLAVGGFPANAILSEDIYVAGKMLSSNMQVAYCAEAKVYHSHDYSVFAEFKRYFDQGVFQRSEIWIRETFGRAEGEGIKFVLSEIHFLLNSDKPYLIPVALTRAFLKYTAYWLGYHHKALPKSLKRAISMNRKYWESVGNGTGSPSQKSVV